MPLNPTAIRTARERLGLTQQQAADAAGMARPNWARLEAGFSPDAKLSTVEAVAKALRVKPGSLISDGVSSAPAR